MKTLFDALILLPPQIQSHKEAYVQHELYRLLVGRGYTVQPEYRIKEFKMRVDLAVFYKDEFLVFIEVKKYIEPVNGKYVFKKHITRNEIAVISNIADWEIEIVQNKYETPMYKQYKKYLSTGQRFIYCIGEDQIMPTIEKVAEILKELKGIEEYQLP